MIGDLHNSFVGFVSFVAKTSSYTALFNLPETDLSSGSETSKLRLLRTLFYL